MNEILKQFPPASINSSREIVKGLIERFNKSPNDRLAREIEQMTGYYPDYQIGDFGEPPERFNKDY